MSEPQRYPSTRITPPSESDPSVSLPHLPQTEGSLELVEKIGEGGMGQVFRVRDRRFQREAALKLLKPDRQAERIRARFCREARVTAFLDHPSIPPVYEYGQTARGELFILMKLVRGQSLRERLNLRGGPGSEDLGELLEILIKVCEALAHAHKRGVVHRDIKPDNILIGRFGEVYLMDWGLARFGPGSEAKTTMSGEQQRRVFGPELTHEGSVVGTWGYMSPEQASGDAVTTASDVYALGAVLYEILWDRTPIQSQGLEAVAATMQGKINYPRSPELPAGLIALCRRCLATGRADRPRSAGRVAEALRAELRGLGSVAPAINRRPRIAAAVFAVLALAATALWLMDRAEKRALLAVMRRDERRGEENEAALAKELRGLTRALARSARQPDEAPRPEPRRPAAVTEDEVFKVVKQSRVIGSRFALQALKAGLRYSTEDRFEDAVRELDRALVLDPLLSKAYSSRGIARHRLRDRAGAMADYNLAIALDPKDADAYNNRGFIHELEGRFAAAGRDYDRAIELDVKLARAFSNRGRLKLNLGDIEGALRDCAVAVKTDDRNPETHNTLGNIFDRINRPQDALREYSRAIQMFPRYAEAYSNRGDLLRNLKQPERALSDLNKAVEYDPALPEAFYNRSLVHYERQDFVAALADLDKTITLNPGFTEAHNNRGVMLKSLGRLTDAIESFNKALAIDQRNTDALINRASVYGLQERFQEALDDFDAAIRANSKLEPELRDSIARFRLLMQNKP